jgi:hypothetical protein
VRGIKATVFLSVDTLKDYKGCIMSIESSNLALLLGKETPVDEHDVLALLVYNINGRLRKGLPA